jgi:protein MpaA
MNLRPRQKIGTIPFEPQIYGHSNLGAPLEVWLPSDTCKVLIFAGIHGEEGDTTLVLSRALRQLSQPSPHCAVVLAANPDGLIRGTRGNARGVELNRNFPSETWKPDPVCHRATFEDPRDIELSPGTHPLSEPETKALTELIEGLDPHTVIAMHAPLDCIEDPKKGTLARWLSQKTGIKLIGDVGYPTPGSFGTWAAEEGYDVITFELPLEGANDMVRLYSPVFVELLLRTDL